MIHDKKKVRKRNKKASVSPRNDLEKSLNYTKYGKDFQQSQIFSRRGLLFLVLSFILVIFVYRDNNQIHNRKSAVKTSSAFLFDDIYTINGDGVWHGLVKEAELLSKITPVVHVIEVGMHSATQCLAAAKKNLQAHCIEPSPASQDKIHTAILAAPNEVQKNVRLYQMAASDSSGHNLEFRGHGSTGDHVGSRGIDVWRMTKESDEIMKKKTDNNSSHTIDIVQSVAIDDIIYNKIGPTKDYHGLLPRAEATRRIDKVFLLKIDTQGFEPNVFLGLKKAIKEQKIDFIMTEYWPKGIDFMNDSMGPQEKCTKPVEILQLLYDSGYKLYALILQSHPKAPSKARKILNRINNDGIEYPMNNLMAHCMWFYTIERDNPPNTTIGEENYQMGYWTDVLAVAPAVTIPTPMLKYSNCIRDAHRQRVAAKKCRQAYGL